MKEHFKDFKTVFLTHLCLNLQYEGLGRNIIERIRREHQEICFAKTASRSVLGSMNDFASQYEVYIKIEGGTERADILAISSKINTSPMSLLKYENPTSALRKLLRL